MLMKHVRLPLDGDKLKNEFDRLVDYLLSPTSPTCASAQIYNTYIDPVDGPLLKGVWELNVNFTQVPKAELGFPIGLLQITIKEPFSRKTHAGYVEFDIVSHGFAGVRFNCFENKFLESDDNRIFTDFAMSLREHLQGSLAKALLDALTSKAK